MNRPNHPPPLILIPGAMSTAVAWQYQIASFSSSRKVMVPDQHYGLETIQAMAYDIAPRLPPHFDLVGWSMGGYVLFELYPLVRERVRKVVLICTTAQAESPDAQQRRGDLLRAVEADGIRAVYERQIDANLLDPSRLDPNFRERVLSATEGLGERTLRSQIHAMTSRRDSRELLRKVTSDTLIIGAKYDAVVPPSRSLEMASLLPHATLQIVELAGHGAPWERSEEVNGLMQQFLDA